jgi:hypothetical protein
MLIEGLVTVFMVLIMVCGFLQGCTDRFKTIKMKEMRRQGATYREIGEKFGFTPSGAWNRVNRM